MSGDEIIKGQTLDNLLRYLLGGTAFLGALSIAFKLPCETLEFVGDDGKLPVSILVLAAFVIGAIIYSIHRAIPMYLISACCWPVSKGEASAPDPEARKGDVSGAKPVSKDGSLEYCRCSPIILTAVAIGICALCASCFKNIRQVEYWPPLSIAFVVTHCVVYLFWNKSKCFSDLMERDLWRWEAGEGSLHKYLREWASQVHGVYCVGWAGLLANDTGRCLGWERSCDYWPVLIASIFIVVVAFIYHMRYLEWESNVFSRAMKNRQSQNATIDTASGGLRMEIVVSRD